MKPGIYHNLPFAEYLAIDALSNTAMGWLEQSPAVFKYRQSHPKAETGALRLGSAAHAATLEPDEFRERFVLEPDPAEVAPDAKNPRATKAYKAARAKLDSEGVSILKADEMNGAEAIADAFRLHPRICTLLDKKLGTETTIVWTRDGVLCKGRFDFYGDGWIADLKTTRDIGGFSPWEITKWRIYRQMAWYRSGARECGLNPNACYLAAVDSAPPHETALFALDSAAMDAGDLECTRLVALYQRCMDADEWPGRFPAEVLPGSISDRQFEQIFEDAA